METCGGRLLCLYGLVLSAAHWVDGAPLPYSATGLTPGLSLDLSLVLSVATLLVLVVVVVNCTTCCKEQEINFKEFEDHFEDELDFTPPAEDTPSAQSPAEVYTLAVPPLPLPGPPHLRPSGVIEGSAALQVARHNLSYIQEVGNGWFGKVLLGDMYSEHNVVARVVVMELQSNASIQEQSRFLQQGDPYRVLQHPNLVQCLGQCVEAIPFLLVLEHCELGDLRTYLAQQDGELGEADKFQVQKMACEIAAGVTYLHKHNFLHSDLALRNCFLTADLTVKVGDYGTGPWGFKEDYITTETDTEIPLRWMAPELIGELNGGVVALEQTKPGNVWALGITLWELFENGAQPYNQLSDTEVLVQVIKEQLVKPCKPQLDLPYSHRWYEVLQFCWLPPDKRATAEEVHRLLTYLRMQAQKQTEEDFEQRWDSLRPNPPARQATLSHSSFPILERFGEEALGREVDEVLTVTETSRGLSFEYVWEAARHDHYDEGSRTSADAALSYRSMFFPSQGYDPQPHLAASAAEKVAISPVTPGIPGVLPVFDVHKAATGNDYYIQLEEQGGRGLVGEGNLVNLTEDPENEETAGKQQYVVLRDIPLEESSTDVDFFHRSIDSKDSYLQESHAWSSSDLESPYHSNIFNENSSKLDDSSSWGKGGLELPEINGNGASLEDVSKSFERNSPFLGNTPEVCKEEMQEENLDVMQLLKTDQLMENFLFLKNRCLMKEGSKYSEQEVLEKDSSERGLDYVPEVLQSENTGVSLTPGLCEGHAELAEASGSPKDKRMNFVSADLTGFSEPFINNEILVPLSSLATVENFSDHSRMENSSLTEDISLHSSGSGMKFSPDATSESTEVTFSPVNGHTSPVVCERATEDILCTGAKSPSHLASLGASREDGYSAAAKDLSEQPGLASPFAHVSKTMVDNDLVSDAVSSTIEDVKNSLNIMLSKAAELLPDDSLVNPGKDLSPSTFLTSDPSLDKISQDSLLDSTVSTPLSITEPSVETPDSWDLLDLHRLGGPAEVISITAPKKLQPPYKPVDSGYETENLESPEWNCQPVAPSPVLQPGLPQIVVSEVEADDGEATLVRPQASLPPVSEPQPEAGQTCRDSAYFSDNESETERKTEDIGVISSTSDGTLWLRSKLKKDVPELVLTAEEDWDRPMMVVIDGKEEGNKLQLLPEVMSGMEDSTVALDPSSTLPVAPRAVQAKLVSAGEAPKLKEPDVEGRYLGKLEGAALTSRLEDGMEADEEDEEDENSEDSDDDMQAYRLHSSASESEDDVEHPVPIVIMDTSGASNLKSLLRNSSSSPARSFPPQGANAYPRKKAISFFDDVTLYLFDQETPTRELGNPTLHSSNTAQFSSPTSMASCLTRSTSEGSTDEEGGGFEWDDDFSTESSFISKATGSLGANRPPSTFFSPPPPSQASPYSASTAGRALEQSWSSRFSISPASIASFSLTHLTDSDTEQGGSSEDGEKD